MDNIVNNDSLLPLKIILLVSGVQQSASSHLTSHLAFPARLTPEPP